MSKRDGAAGVTDYLKMGYLKEALINFIALLGWSPGDDREIMSLEEMIEAFSLDRINPANAIFDLEKLTWMNGEYIRKTENYKLVDLLRPFLVESGMVTQLFINTRWDHMIKFVAMMKERCRLLTDFADQGYYLFTDNFTYDDKGVQKHFSAPEVYGYLKRWRETLEIIEPFDIEHLEQALRDLAEKLTIKPAELIHPTRLALSGTTKGPSLFEMMEFLGKDHVWRELSGRLSLLKVLRMLENCGKKFINFFLDIKGDLVIYIIVSFEGLLQRISPQ